jgi:hypothetical protein
MMSYIVDKPTTLEIRAENSRLVGTDEFGQNWVIRWCGNGSYSHWVLCPDGNMNKGIYVYLRPNPTYETIIRQIEAAEHKFKIYN